VGCIRCPCETTLLPLAGAGIVHPDIRPGFDVTANVLVAITHNERLTSFNSIAGRHLYVVAKIAPCLGY
jgi:hypothetical protein